MPFDKLWDSFARILPDSRARHSTGEIRHKTLGNMEKIYCVNCGVEGGFVMRDSVPFVSYLCNKCVFQFGQPPLLPVPEDEERIIRGS
jgi:hypothetical protein